MEFQITKTKDYLRMEAGRLLKIINTHEDAIEFLEVEINWIAKCREEINTANKILREK